MEDNKKRYLFEQAPPPKAVLSMSIPTVISSLVMVIYNLADTYFVGMLNNPIQNAAVTLAAPVLLAFNAVNNLFGVGSSSMMSRSLGSKSYDTAYRVSVFGFFCSLIAGLLFSVLFIIAKYPMLHLLGADSDTFAATGEYLKWTVGFGAAPSILNVVMAYLVRAEGSTLHASIGTMSGCLLNIILDPLFILPQFFNMGAAGAGLATFISNCIACLYFFILLSIKRNHTYVCINPRMLRFSKEIAGGVFIVGIPAAIQNLLNVTGMTVLNNFTAAFGADAVAAMGVAQKLNMIPLQIAFGFSQGIMPLVSYNYASKDIKRTKSVVMFSARLTCIFVIAVSAAFWFGSGTLIKLFMQKESVVAYGSRFLRGLCIALPFLNIDFLAVGIFQATGMGKSALIFAILRKIVFEIPALVILNALFPLYGLAYAQPLSELILAVVAVIVLRRMFRSLRLEQATP